jgi:hypothetical protein
LGVFDSIDSRVDAEKPADVPPLRFVVTDLPGNTLGSTTGHLIQLDRNAAGAGWFVDPTPGDDSEFNGDTSDSPARLRYDLLTVVAHEVGHALGLDHDHHEQVMADTLTVGERRLPGASTGDPVDAASFDASLLLIAGSNRPRDADGPAHPPSLPLDILPPPPCDSLSSESARGPRDNLFWEYGQQPSHPLVPCAVGDIDDLLSGWR